MVLSPSLGKTCQKCGITVKFQVGIEMKPISKMQSSSQSETESRAFVVRMVDYRDSDRIVTLFTEDTGKVSALARGAKKSRKRFGAALSPYMLGRVKLKGSLHGGKLPTLSDIQPLEHFPNIGKDMIRLALAGYFAELCRETIPESNPEPGIFELLLEAHRIMNSGRPKRALVRAFELHLLTRLGFSPQLDRCGGSSPDAACNTELVYKAGPPGSYVAVENFTKKERGISGYSANNLVKEDIEINRGKGDNGDPNCGEKKYAFDLTLGGALCSNCAEKVAGNVKKLTGESLHFMRVLLSNDLSEIAESGFDLSPSVNNEIRQALGPTLIHLSGKPLKSLSFIQKLRQWETPHSKRPTRQTEGQENPPEGRDGGQ